MRIKVKNEYLEKEYCTDRTLEDWRLFMEKHKKGKEEFFHIKDKLTGKFVAIHPTNFDKIEVINGW